MGTLIFNTNDIGNGVRAILGAGDDTVILPRITVGSHNNAAITATGSNQSVSVFGNVLSPGNTIFLGDDATDSGFSVVIETAGVVATTGVAHAAILVGGTATIQNKGTIRSESNGIAFDGGLNLGYSTVINSGLIVADETGVLFDAVSLFRLTNTGRIEGRSGTAIDASASVGYVEIVNHGEIIGGVELGSGDDSYVGSGRISTILNAGAGDDIITGGGEMDRFFGGLDDDTLTGNGNDDALIGNEGADLLNGGIGNDFLHGGTGSDVFIFNVALTAGNRDRIVDFNRVDDTIRLENAIFKNTGANGTLSASMFKLSTKPKDANDRIIYNKATGDIAFDPDGSGAKKAVVFVTLETKPTITNADFVII